MANSFGDQFLKAGLVSKDQVHKAKKSKHKQKKQNSAAVNEAAVAAQQAGNNRGQTPVLYRGQTPISRIFLS